ncbi:hypothetical protein P879_00890 [Paragonimus westermani]|uniref:Importin N-terminal domain-containing protein n=1 Tax=Paragonimus westermani TaxID=34504 RepID=A0A8T0E126_9TREM|nr:hypothetical protein P879_00890 [Paragonimus westermani]
MIKVFPVAAAVDYPAMDDATTNAVISTFAVVLGQEAGDRRLAEQRLTALEILDSYPGILANLVANEQVAVEIRQLAGITLKQYVSAHWDAIDCVNFKPPQPTEEAKSHIRTTVLQTLHSPVRLIRTTAAHCISTIAQYDWPDAWPDLITELSRLLDTVTLDKDANLELGKAVVHGVMRVLASISGELSDLDIPQITPLLMPSLVRVLCDNQRFGSATRRNVVSVINNLINIMLSTKDMSVFQSYVDNHFKLCLNRLVSDLEANHHTLEESEFEAEVLQLLTSLCMDMHRFVSHQLDGGLARLTNTLWHLLLRITETYVQSKVAVHSVDSNREGDIDEDANLVDSDGESVDYNNLVYALLDFLSRLAGAKRYRSRLETHLPDVCYQVARLLQLPTATLRRWSSGVTEFLEDSEETLGCSVRLSALDVLKRFSSLFKSWPVAFTKTLSQLFNTAESQNAKGDPNWWKGLEVGLLLCANFPQCLSCDPGDPMHAESASTQLETVCTRYIWPSLQQSDFPPLQVSALRCITQLSLHNVGNGPRLEDLPTVLVEGLAQNRHPILRVSSVKALGDVGNRLRQLRSPLTPESSSPDVCVTQHLSTLVAGVVDCLSTFGEPILDDGLYALHTLLRVDPAGFTMLAQSQVTVVLVDLFKHCINVASTLSIYLDVLRTVMEAGNASSNELVEQAFMPTLLTCLEQQDSFDSVAVEAALKLLCVLVTCSAPNLSSVLIQRVFPAVVHVAITSSDAVIISGCCDVLRCFLAVGVDRILDWHDDEGNNGVGYILHVTSRLLDPSGPVEWATAAGRLVCAMLLRLQTEQLGENVDLLLRGTLARLSTLPLTSESQSSNRTLYTLDGGNLNTANLEAGSIGGARQSLVFVFVVLCRLQPEAAINFLASVPDPTGQPVIGKLMRLWCACQPFYFAPHEIRISILALSNLLLYVITTQDGRLMQIQTDGSEIDDHCALTTVASRTRNKQRDRTHDFLQIPLVVKMYKLLLNELIKVLEESTDEVSDDDEEEEEETDDENEVIEANGVGVRAEQSTTGDLDEPATFKCATHSMDDHSDSDSEDMMVPDDPIYSKDPAMTLDVKEHLCELFRNLSKQSFYNEFSRYHTEMELSVLQKTGILPT